MFTESTNTQITYLMHDLVAAGESGNTDEFIKVVERVNWTEQTASNFIVGVNLSLEVGAHLTARELSEMGHRLYPENSELAKMSRVLAPPRTNVGKGATGSSRRQDFVWLKECAERYRGQWIALKNGELVAAASTVSELKKLVSDTQDVFLTKG